MQNLFHRNLSWPLPGHHLDSYLVTELQSGVRVTLKAFWRIHEQERIMQESGRSWRRRHIWLGPCLWTPEDSSNSLGDTSELNFFQGLENASECHVAREVKRTL